MALTNARIKAIQELYPNTNSINDDGSAYDSNGDAIALDESAISAILDVKQAELDLDELRRVRNRLLMNTDWWAVADRTMTAEQTAYRQALRDITETYSSLDDVVWPTKPE